MKRQRMVAVCLVMVLSAALSACGGLATESAVQQGAPVGEALVQPVRVQPDGPTSGATPQQIVGGFIRAGSGAGFDDDHAIARSFFTPTARDLWQPDSGVVVYADDPAPKIEQTSASTVRVTATVIAQIDAGGLYREMPAGSVAHAAFAVEKLPVGWRISAPQKGFGLWLSASDLDRIYRPFTIAYVSASASARAIVGERRWFPITSGLATLLARAQLAPVPAYLSGAAQTGVPVGTRLGVDAVPIQSGRAVVDLAQSALSAGPELRQAMWAQFVSTLTQVPAVTAVSLEVDGASLELPGTPDRVSVLTTLGYQIESGLSVKTAILRDGPELSRVPSDRPPDRDGPRQPAKPPVAPVLPHIPVGWVSLALSRDSEQIAAIGGDHADLALWQGDRKVQLNKFGTQLTKPSYDSRNGLWVAGQVGKLSKVWVVDTTVTPLKAAKPREVSAPWLARRKVVALRVASDDQRVALITTDLVGGDLQVAVAGITRSDDGLAVSLAAEPLRVGWPLTAATDLAWVDDSTLVVIARAGAKALLGPQLVDIGGKVTPLSPVFGARLVTSTGGVRGIVVVTDRDKVLARAGNGWQELQTGTDFLLPGE